MTKRHRAFLALCRTTLMAGLALIFTGCQFFSPDGLYIRDYDPARHDRFYEGADRVFLGEIYNWSGVGVVREDGEIEAWATMVAAQYFLSAHHRHPEPGDVLTFWEGNDPAGAITYWGDQIRHTLPHLYVDDFQLSGIVRLGTENGRHGLQLVGSIVNLCRASELTVGKLLAQLPKSETAGLGNSSDLGSANSANIFALFPDGVPEDERLVMLEVKLQTNSARPKEEQVSKRQIAR